MNNDFMKEDIRKSYNLLLLGYNEANITVVKNPQTKLKKRVFVTDYRERNVI